MITRRTRSELKRLGVGVAGAVAFLTACALVAGVAAQLAALVLFLRDKGQARAVGAAIGLGVGAWAAARGFLDYLQEADDGEGDDGDEDERPIIPAKRKETEQVVLLN